jgi:septin family protein
MKGRKMVGHYKIIIVGESGLGKSTARDCLLHGLRKDPARLGETQSPDQKTLDIVTSDPIQIHTESPLEEIWLRIVDTPGYGDHMDINKDIGKIRDFIVDRFDELYDAQRAGGVAEMHHDSLVTCCLYFIAPHRLKDNDIEFMKEISKLLPIVPVIAKADTMTSQETTDFRKEVSEKMRQANIRLYDFEHDPRIADKPDLPPFTLITDRSMMKRVYNWGTCELNNAAHSDFTLLKDLVIKDHLYVSDFLSPCCLLPPPLLHHWSVVLACPLRPCCFSRLSCLASHDLPCHFFLTQFRAHTEDARASL